MPELSGLEFMQVLNGKCKVILVTAYKDYAMQGYDNDVVDYLLKPVTFPRFLQSARKLLAAQENRQRLEDDYTLVNSGTKGKLQKINIDDILYVESQKQYAGFNTRQGRKYLSLIGLRELETRMPSGKFIRVHRSFLLATRYITTIQHSMVYLEHTSKVIPIGAGYRKAFMGRMADKMIT
jgi:two-component system LytT family response regulator